MAIQNKDGTFTMNKDMSGSQFLEYLFNPFAKNYTRKETADLSLNEVNSMLEGERQADIAIKEGIANYEETGQAPLGWNEAAYGDFGTYVAERNKKKQQGTLTFSEGVLPFLNEDQLNKFYPDLFKDALKQDGNEDFKRINLGDLKGSAQRGEDGKVVYNPSVTTMVPNEDGTFAIRENDVTMDGRNQSDGGESLGAFTVRGSDLDVIYDAKKTKLLQTAPAGTEQGIRMMNQITSRNLTMDDVLNSYNQINNPTTPRETVIQTIAGLSDELETNKQPAEGDVSVGDTTIETKGLGSGSVTQEWDAFKKDLGPDSKYGDALNAFMQSEQVIEVDENNYSKKGFTVNGRKLLGTELLDYVRNSKDYVVEGRGSLSVDGQKNRILSVNQIANQYNSENIPTDTLDRPKFNTTNIESLFDKEQWDSLSNPEKKEMFALVGEITSNNTLVLQEEKLDAITKPGPGLSADETRTEIINNTNYRNFFSGTDGQANINALIKNPEINNDFRNLSPQEFTKKYSVDGKLDEKTLVGNEVPPEAKKVLKDVITKEQVDEFAELIEKNDIEGITKLVNSINISEEDNKVLTEALVKAGGDFRKMTQRNADIDIVRSYVLSSLATFPKTAPLAPYLTNISIGTFIETGMLNTQGTALASQIQQDRRLNATAGQADLKYSDPYEKTLDQLNARKKDSVLNEDSTLIQYEDYFKGISPLINDLKTKAVTTADKRDYAQQLIEVMKRFSAEQQPNFWREVFSLGYARGGNLNLFGNDIDAIVTKNKNGEVTGLRIGDIPYEIQDLRDKGFSNSFINILIAAGDANQRQQSR